MQRHKDSRMVVFAIYIGQNHSSCAWSFCHDPCNITTFNACFWDEQLQLQTTVLFNEQEELITFGQKAEERFEELSTDERKRWYLLKNIVNPDCCSGNTMTKAVDGKEIETHIVYGAIIRFFKTEISALFTKLHVYVHLEDILWVLSVPNVLTRSRQTMLQKAFHEAGIQIGNYTLAKEMNAVVSFCRSLWTTEDSPKIKDTSKFVVLNLRGATASISACELRGGEIYLLSELSGGGWGGQAVSEEFKQLLIKIVGAPVFMKCSEDHLDMEHEIEHIKKRYDYNTKQFRLKIPVSIRYEYESMYDESIANAIAESEFNGKISIVSNIWKFHSSIIEGLFNNSITQIISNISAVTTDVKEIDAIIMLGGFSRSSVVQNAVRKAFPDTKVHIPEDPSVSVLRGTVLYGHFTPTLYKHFFVSDRSYWFLLSHVNNESDRKEIVRSEKKVIINSGDSVYSGKIVTWELDLLDFTDMEHIELILFKSPDGQSSPNDSDGRKLWEKHEKCFSKKQNLELKVKFHHENENVWINIMVSGAFYLRKDIKININPVKEEK